MSILLSIIFVACLVPSLVSGQAIAWSPTDATNCWGASLGCGAKNSSECALDCCCRWCEIPDGSPYCFGSASGSCPDGVKTRQCDKERSDEEEQVIRLVLCVALLVVFFLLVMAILYIRKLRKERGEMKGMQKISEL